MGVNVPDGYLSCDGTVYNINDYPALADFIDIEFGSIDNFGGDGTTTFAVPDLRGEFLRGTGTNSHTNQGSGANVGTHQDATEITDIGYSRNSGIQMNISYTSGNEWSSNIDTNLTRQGYCVAQGIYNSSEASVVGRYTSRPTNTSVQFCIKY